MDELQALKQTVEDVYAAISGLNQQAVSKAFEEFDIKSIILANALDAFRKLFAAYKHIDITKFVLTVTGPLGVYTAEVRVTIGYTEMLFVQSAVLPTPSAAILNLFHITARMMNEHCKTPCIYPGCEKVNVHGGMYIIPSQRASQAGGHESTGLDSA